MDEAAVATAGRASPAEVGAADSEAVRRVDWRFLLDRPTLDRVVVDGTEDPVLLAGLRATATEVTALEPRPGKRDPGPFDLAVLVAPSAERLEDVARRAEPRAWIVAELAPPWRRIASRRGGARVMGPRAAARILRRQGLAVELRWIWPNFEGALELVPFDDPAALDQSLRRRRSRRARLTVPLVRIAARLGWLPPLLPAVAAIAHRPADQDAFEAGFLATAIEAATERVGRDRSSAVHRIVVLTPRYPASRHVIALAIDGHGRLDLVAKAPRRREDDGGLRREAAALERIASGVRPGVAIDPAAAVVAPRSLGLTDVRGWPVLLETAVTGTPLGRRTIRADRGRWVGAARDLADRLAAAGGAAPGVAGLGEAGLDEAGLDEAAAGGTTVGDASLPEAAPTDVRLRRLVAEPLGRLATTLPAGDPLAAWIPRTLAALERLAAVHLPPVLEHGDLAPPNLLVTDGGGLVAVDWEFAEPDGLPGHDLALFLHFAAVAVARPGAERDPAATSDAIEAAFLGSEPWAIAALRGHLEAVGVDPGLALPLAAVAFARVTVSMPARARRAAGPWLATDRHAVAWVRLLRGLA